MAASLRSKGKISEISYKTSKKSEAEADKPLSYVKDKNCKLHEPDDSYLSKLLCGYEEQIGMLKSELSKKDNIIFYSLQIVSSFKENKTLIRNDHDVRENPLVQTLLELQTQAEQGRHDNEGMAIRSANNCTVWEVPRNHVQSVNLNTPIPIETPNRYDF